ncbi:MAG: primosomal protein N', partial [Candidatus Rokubacteria bacterium]|nr:primosomal protein N' [Candidatus Rokubacteria bacterium]
MIADVIFDIPLTRSFAYRIPPGLAVAVGQRVRAPLHGRLRTGVVIARREGVGEGLTALDGTADPEPLLGPIQLHLTRWIESESFSSWGSSCAALLPPAPPRPEVTRVPAARAPALDAGPDRLGADASGPRNPPQLLTGGDREERLLALLTSQAEERGLLLLVPEVEAARQWADRLRSRLGRPVARLDSGRPRRERWRAWMELASGSLRVAVGTRSGLLAPVPAPATLVLVDEHDPAHKPPGHPRIHSRQVVIERAGLEGHSVILSSATPSIESWWNADSGRLIRAEGSPAPWPAVEVVDARGGLRSSPLSRELRRRIDEALAGAGQVCLLVTRISSVLACGECGFLARCPGCDISQAYSRARRECSCRLCGRRAPAPDTCPQCLGHKLASLGWGAERVEQAVRQAYPRLTQARYDSEALTPARTRQLVRQWEEGAVRLVIGTRQALKALSPSRLKLVGVVTPDHLLRLPDFRAGERAFALLWAAAEWVGDRGRLIIQTQ